MTKILTVDVDSTVTDHWRRIRRNTYPRWPNGEISPLAWTWAELERDAVLPNCIDALCGLIEADYAVRYLTARGWPTARQDTVEQLKRLGLPSYDGVDVVQCMRDKVRFLREHPPHFYVDDFMTGQERSVGTFHREVAAEIEALGIHVIAFRNDWLDVLDQIALYLRATPCES